DEPKSQIVNAGQGGDLARLGEPALALDHRAYGDNLVAPGHIGRECSFLLTVVRPPCAIGAIAERREIRSVDHGFGVIDGIDMRRHNSLHSAVEKPRYRAFSDIGNAG